MRNSYTIFSIFHMNFRVHILRIFLFSHFLMRINNLNISFYCLDYSSIFSLSCIAYRGPGPRKLPLIVSTVLVISHSSAQPTFRISLIVSTSLSMINLSGSYLKIINLQELHRFLWLKSLNLIFLSNIGKNLKT